MIYFGHGTTRGAQKYYSCGENKFQKKKAKNKIFQ